MSDEEPSEASAEPSTPHRTPDAGGDVDDSGDDEEGDAAGAGTAGDAGGGRRLGKRLAALRASRRLRRLGTTTHWDRPVVRDWRWGLRIVGRTLIVIGLLMFGFVAYQLWGTGIETARYQNELEDEFEDLLAQQVSTGTPDGTTSTDRPATATTPAPPPARSSEPGAGHGAEPPPASTAPARRPPPPSRRDLPPIELGSALGKIEIPKIDLDFYIVAGVGYDDLKRGVGHFPETPLPGEFGNSALAGHRTTWGNPFYHIDRIEPGDEIIITTVDGRFVYRATGQQIVSPSDTWVIATTDPDTATLTLTSCNPRFSSSERIVVTAELARTGDGPIGQPLRDYASPADDDATASTRPSTLPADTRPSSVPDDARLERPDRGDDHGARSDADAPARPVDGDGERRVELSNRSTDAFESNWFSDTSAFVDVAIWTLVVSLIAAAGYFIAWYLKRDWVGIVVVALPFVVALYFFYQNVNRLLPAAL